MKSKIATIASLAMAMGTSFGAVSLNFSADFESGISQNLANIAGTQKNGLTWGVLVDGSGNGIINWNEVTQVGTKYIAPTLVSGVFSYVLSTASGLTDDVLTFASSLTVDTSITGTTEGDNVTTGGPGGIYDINVALTNGVGTGDLFYVVWFDNVKTGVGGVLADASFTIPTDTFAVNYGLPFVGVDPLRKAGSGYSGTSGTANSAGGIALVPEPSAALLGALGALGLLRRRRN